MKKFIFIAVLLIVISSVLYADEISDVLKANTGKQVSVFLKNYTLIRGGNASNSVTLNGEIISCSEKTLIIQLTKNNKYNPMMKNSSSKLYIRIDEIAAVQIPE